MAANSKRREFPFRTSILITLSILLAVCFGYFCELSEMSKLEREVMVLLDSTQRTVRLLSRTSVVENGLKYGGSEVIEALLNRSMLGEDHISRLWAKSNASADAITNTYSSKGLYLGGLDADLKSGFIVDTDSRWVWSGAAFQLSVPVEHEEELVGNVGVEIDPSYLLARLSADANLSLGEVILPVGKLPRFSLSHRLAEIEPRVFLVLKAPFWIPRIFLLAIFSAGLAAWASYLWDRANRMQVLKVESQEALYRQALQVAHDIRSPVGALWSLQSRLTGMEEVDKEVFQSAIRRIDHIAEDLLEKYRVGNFGPSFSWLGHGVAKVVQECKAAEAIRRPRLNIEMAATALRWNLRIQMRPHDTQQVVATLLKNAIEAADPHHPAVEMGWEGNSKTVRLFVRHNGSLRGKKILSHRLGTAYLRSQRCSYAPPAEISRKDRTWIEASVSFQIFEGIVDSPVEISIPADVVVVVLDDDIAIHNWFRRRLPDQEMYFAEGNDSFENVLKALGKRRALFFIDFRLSPTEATGPEIAHEKGIQGFLITSSPDDPGVLEAAARWKMGVIPKSILPYLPFREVDTKLPKLTEQPFHLLVDDDPLTRQSWKLSAGENGIEVKTFATFEEFESNLPPSEPRGVLFLDGGLSNLERISQAKSWGFHQIYITTGNPPSFAYLASEVEAILDKRPPWNSPRFCFRSGT